MVLLSLGRMQRRACVSTPDSPAAELEQLDLQALCDGLRRYLLDLPHPIIPVAVCSDMVHIAQGEVERPALQRGCGNGWSLALASLLWTLQYDQAATGGPRCLSRQLRQWGTHHADCAICACVPGKEAQLQ